MNLTGVEPGTLRVVRYEQMKDLNFHTLPDYASLERLDPAKGELGLVNTV